MKNSPFPYLNQYMKNPCLETLDSIGADVGVLPEAWIRILSVSGKERLACVIDEWRKFGDAFFEVIPKFEKDLVSVTLLKNQEKYSLLYEISGKTKSLYYEAKNPFNRNFNKNIEALWPKMPESVRNFYDFHDGWFYLASQSLGPSPSEAIFLLADEDWGILDEIPGPPVNLDMTVALFTNGSSGYVCLDLSKPDTEHSALIWWSNKEPKLGIKFWDVVDAWMVLGMDA